MDVNLNNNNIVISILDIDLFNNDIIANILNINNNKKINFNFNTIYVLFKIKTTILITILIKGTFSILTFFFIIIFKNMIKKFNINIVFLEKSTFKLLLKFKQINISYFYILSLKLLSFLLFKAIFE